MHAADTPTSQQRLCICIMAVKLTERDDSKVNGVGGATLRPVAPLGPTGVESLVDVYADLLNEQLPVLSGPHLPYDGRDRVGSQVRLVSARTVEPEGDVVGWLSAVEVPVDCVVFLGAAVGAGEGPGEGLEGHTRTVCSGEGRREEREGGRRGKEGGEGRREEREREGGRRGKEGGEGRRECEEELRMKESLVVGVHTSRKLNSDFLR